MAGNGERGVALLVRDAQHLVDGRLRENRAGGIVDDDLVAVLELVAQEKDAVPRGIVRSIAAGDDPLHLGNLVFVEDFLQVVDPVFDAHDEDAVDVLVLLEVLERVDDDGLVVEGEKLLGHGASHALSDSAREDDGDMLHTRLLRERRSARVPS